MDGGFSVVLPVRGTEGEMGRAERSLLSAIRLGPGQIVLGVDEGRPGLERRLRGMCEGAGYSGCTTVAVPRSAAWGFQLSHVVWHCIRASRHDRILIYNVDSELLPAVMKGGGQVGRGVAVASHTMRPRLRTPPDLFRCASYRLWVRRHSYVFSGTFWIWRPHVLEALRMADYASVRNGMDSKIAEAARAGGYSVVTNKEAGSAHFGLQNGDLPWRQFQMGVWVRAHAAPEAARARRRGRLAAARFWARHLAGVANHAALWVRPHYLRGYLWAARRPAHAAVAAAASMGRAEWEHAGSAHVGAVLGRSEGTGGQAPQGGPPGLEDRVLSRGSGAPEYVVGGGAA